MRWFRWSSEVLENSLHLSVQLPAFLVWADVVDVCVRGANQYLLWICISNVHGIGKATFLWYFFQYTSFITGKDSNIKGTLADTFVDMQICSQGLFGLYSLSWNHALITRSMPQGLIPAHLLHTLINFWSPPMTNCTNTVLGSLISTKTSGVELLSKIKWFHQLMPCGAIGRGHVGSSMCGDRLTKTTWSYSPSTWVDYS